MRTEIEFPEPTKTPGRCGAVMSNPCSLVVETGDRGNKVGYLFYLIKTGLGTGRVNNLVNKTESEQKKTRPTLSPDLHRESYTHVLTYLYINTHVHP